jgi:isoleucyl-tRNA synthetase
MLIGVVSQRRDCQFVAQSCKACGIRIFARLLQTHSGMKPPYREFRSLDLPDIHRETLAFWNDRQIFRRSIEERDPNEYFVFYEGPPSANGMPGIHHVMARTIKDIFCRYKTLQGKRVVRKAGWDTHGLPIELAVEKTLGIRKEDIGSKISVEEYNAACRREVMKYTDRWEELTKLMGYWVDMSDPYITYDNRYIETVWWLLQKLGEKNLLYKGYTIQPYSPAAGTGLSSHELNQPGCYREVKDTSAIAQFKLISAPEPLSGYSESAYFLAWTTTPWTLPSNTALAVGEKIRYAAVRTFNPYDHRPVIVILASDLVGRYFPDKNSGLAFADYTPGDKQIPFETVAEFAGSDLISLRYEQLLPFARPDDGDAFRVISGDFVTTEDGTGIVHIAPSFGADDFRVARLNGIGSLTLVDRQGRFLPEVKDDVFLYGGEYVKEDYYSEEEKNVELERQKAALSGFIRDTSRLSYLSVDERITLRLQNEGKLFKKEKYAHNYPHCWRTDKPIIYYPLDSWFIRVTAVRERLIELNREINWRPESTGTGRFGNWLENANDWNLSRSRFWGIPLPIWRTADGTEQLIIGSVEQLQTEIGKSVAAGFMEENPLRDFRPNVHSADNYGTFDLHKPYVDDIVLVSSGGERMTRESDLIDVWFDSGAMPYAQLHYPFENRDLVDSGRNFPADFIAEGVDQTRGWFYTLHAIATMCFDSVAYRNVISNGLVLDRNGNKMSKRLGNAVDPFETINRFGADATRWYMISNAQPWDNLKFDLEGIVEVQRRFFGTLFNTYSFFAIYANIDRFVPDPDRPMPLGDRSEMDRWILSSLATLTREVQAYLDDYNPTPAVRAVEEFVDRNLSNWYVRLSRKRFWHGDLTADKQAAYETLHTCLTTVAQLISPVAPFFADWLFRNLTLAESEAGASLAESVHLSRWPVQPEEWIDRNLEQRMKLAQDISSMVLSIRKKEGIRVRQPLGRIRIPALDELFGEKVRAVADLIRSEVNVKEIEVVGESESRIVKDLKLNFKTLGSKCGKHMKAVQQFAAAHAQEIIASVESEGLYRVRLEEAEIDLLPEDVEIIAVDIPGWKVANQGTLTVALDVTITEELRAEGIAREFVNRIQNLRKSAGLDVTDKISVKIGSHPSFDAAVRSNSEYIRAQVLAGVIELVPSLNEGEVVEIDEGVTTLILINKLN